MRLLAGDLSAIRDREARKRGAIAVLEDLGYTVQLERAARQPRESRRLGSTLKIVRDIRPSEETRSDDPD